MTKKFGISVRDNIPRKSMQPYNFFEKHISDMSSITGYKTWKWNEMSHFGKSINYNKD